MHILAHKNSTTILALATLLAGCGTTTISSDLADEGLPPPISQTATFRGDKVPYDRRFPKALFPYAQKQDGCSSHDRDHTEWVRDNWSLVDFTDTCHAHDRCYYTLNSGVRTCNDRFGRDLLDDCQDRVDQEPHLILTLQVCKSLARNYHAVVVQFEDETYDDAQELQSEYITHARGFMRQLLIDYTGKSHSVRTVDIFLSHLKRKSLAAVERDIIAEFGTDVVTSAFKRLTGIDPTRSQVHDLVPLLQAIGFQQMQKEVYIRHSEQVVKHTYREITGNDNLPTFYLMYYKRLLIGEGLGELKRQIENQHT